MKPTGRPSTVATRECTHFSGRSTSHCSDRHGSPNASASISCRVGSRRVARDDVSTTKSVVTRIGGSSRGGATSAAPRRREPGKQREAEEQRGGRVHRRDGGAHTEQAQCTGEGRRG